MSEYTRTKMIWYFGVSINIIKVMIIIVIVTVIVTEVAI